MAFLILHGLEGSGPEHWQTWVAERLRGRGLRVSFPELPAAAAPRLAEWLEALRAELEGLPREETTVLCHSLGSLLWLHHDGRPVRRALLVAPPQPDEEVPPAVGFRPVPAPRSAARETRFVCSTDDPWCPPERSQALADAVGAPVDWLVNAGHVNADAGFGPWPALEAWCLGERPSRSQGCSYSAAVAAFGRRPRRAAARPGIWPAQSSQRSATLEPRRAST